MYTGQVSFSLNELPNRNTRQRHLSETRGTFSTDKTIEERSKEVNHRLEFGHWEVDTVLSSRGETKDCLITFVERKSRLLWAIKSPNRTSNSLNATFDKFMSSFAKEVKSITVDHGKEFAKYKDIENKYQIKVYFCHPYTP